MARLAPIFLAFLINWYGLILYKMIPPLCICSTLLSRRLFTFGIYFILIDTDLYPRKFKSVHWLVRNTIEFLIGLYLMESFLGEFWYPLENGILRLLVVTAKMIRVYSPKSGSIYKVSSNIFDILTNKRTPMLTSIVLSAAFLFVALHGTRTIDFGIIPRCGVPEFLSHVLNKTKKGLRKLKKSFLLKSDKSDLCR